MIPLSATRQGLNKVPLGGSSEVTPKPRSCLVSRLVQTLL